MIGNILQELLFLFLQDVVELNQRTGHKIFQIQAVLGQVIMEIVSIRNELQYLHTGV